MGEWRADARALSICQRIGMAFGGEKPDEIVSPILPYIQPKIDADAAMEHIKALNAARPADG
jgi:hypothetical protein